MNPRGNNLPDAIIASQKIAQAQTPRPGNGSLLSKTSFGFAVQGNPGNNRFNHPFRPSLIGKSVTFSAGYVNNEFVPTIRTKAGKNVPITGDNNNAVPVMELDANAINKTLLQSWACLEVTPKEDGSLDKNSLIQIVHRDAPTSIDAKIGRQPIALILWTENKQPLRVLSQVWFNLKYVRTTPQSVGNGIPRHFFL